MVSTNHFSSGSGIYQMGALTPKVGAPTYCLAKNFPKTAWKWKKLDQEGRSLSLSTPPWICQCTYFAFFVNFWRTSVYFAGPLIPLFWIPGDIFPGFKARVDARACTPCHLHATDSSDSPLVWHLLTSQWLVWQLSHFDPHTCVQALVGLESRTDRATALSILHFTPHP